MRYRLIGGSHGRTAMDIPAGRSRWRLPLRQRPTAGAQMGDCLVIETEDYAPQRWREHGQWWLIGRDDEAATADGVELGQARCALTPEMAMTMPLWSGLAALGFSLMDELEQVGVILDPPLLQCIGYDPATFIYDVRLTAPVLATNAHLRHQQAPCGPCRAAWAEYHRKRHNAT